MIPPKWMQHDHPLHRIGWYLYDMEKDPAQEKFVDDMIIMLEQLEAEGTFEQGDNPSDILPAEREFYKARIQELMHENMQLKGLPTGDSPIDKEIRKQAKKKSKPRKRTPEEQKAHNKKLKNQQNKKKAN